MGGGSRGKLQKDTRMPLVQFGMKTKSALPKPPDDERAHEVIVISSMSSGTRSPSMKKKDLKHERGLSLREMSEDWNPATPFTERCSGRACHVEIPATWA